MATKYFSIRGQSLWAKLKEPDEFNGTRKYKIGVIPDGPEDWNTIKESGIKVRSKKDEKGAEYITLNRPADAKVGADGNMFGGGKPLVIHPDKSEFDRLLGNGSKVEVVFCTYDGKMGKGHRLETIIVHELVPYERPDDDDMERNFKGIPLPSNNSADAPVVTDEVAAPVNNVPLEPKKPF